MRERFELAMLRIAQIQKEDKGLMEYQPFFCHVAGFICMCMEYFREIESGKMSDASQEELQAINDALYEDILADNYNKSYANPAYAHKVFDKELAGLCCVLYTEMRSLIPFIYEQNLTAITIRLELFLEVYSLFDCKINEDHAKPSYEEFRDVLYWYISDYSDMESERRVREQVDSDLTFAADIIMNSDFKDLRYLYAYGERVTQNELKTAAYIHSLPEETIDKMAFTFTEGFRMGFVTAGKDLSAKETVNIRYRLGFERVIRKAIIHFEVMGLKPVIYRAGADIFTRKAAGRIGYYGAVANPQYDYDHREDMAYFFDGHMVTRRLECLTAAFEEFKNKASKHAGPACMEVFGEEIFEPVSKPENARYDNGQQALVVDYTAQAGMITNTYIKREERSFTIIAFPTAEIGSEFPAIFQEVIALNTLDYTLYQNIQQTIINTLDQAEYVHIKGCGNNRTNLDVQLVKLDNPKKQTKFENCVADVNIPVGEVFTSPVLKGTTGVLHVSKVYLNDYEYRNLELKFENGIIADYICDNFDTEEENKKFIEENLLFHHPTLPLGEFAIGTNTTAYVMAQKYNIGAKLPILIAEKMGPHFAVGDTCYSHEEDVKVYNPDGKEIIARENDYSLLRHTEPKKAYFNCHTDITIPYDEIGLLEAVRPDGIGMKIIENGRFVLEGCENLNAPFLK
ncbi:MAG: aminopeptidase [Lachnospiraceae bacterium]|nr:aminopeptidase [Lachnospiraceae bacterium]